MNKILRLYNQNRITIWIVILVIIFVLAVMRIFNNTVRENKEIARKENEASIINSVIENKKNYDDQSKTIVSGGNVDANLKNVFGSLIENFFKCCIQGEYEKAYEYLSKDCKEELFPNIKSFERLYCKDKFDVDKEISFQSWTTTNAYVYRVKIFDSILATGKSSEKDYIEEFVSIVEDNGYKLNVDRYVGKVKLNTQESVENVTIKVIESNIYMDDTVYTIVVKNNSENNVLLDAKIDDNSVFLLDDKRIEYYSFMNELNEEDLFVKAGQEKKIKIKFDSGYKEDFNIKKIVFSNVVLNEKEFKDNREKFVNIELDT